MTPRMRRGDRILAGSIVALRAREPWLSTRDIAERCHTSQSTVVRILRLDKLERLAEYDSKDATHHNRAVGGDGPIGSCSSASSVGESGAMACDSSKADGDRGRFSDVVACRGCGRWYSQYPRPAYLFADGTIAGGMCFQCYERERHPEQAALNDLERLLAG